MPQNFTNNPSSVLEQVFSDIHQNRMKDLPFVNENLSVKATGFALFEGDWLGVLLTPWTLSLILIPGPDRLWQKRTVGDKVGLRLPSGDYTFTYGVHEELGNYFACSVQSPVQDIASQAIGEQLSKDLRQLVTAIPTQELHVRDESRRALFGLKTQNMA